MAENDTKNTNNTKVSIETIQQTMDKFLAAADVKAVYGEPIEHGDTLIIPAAEVLSGMGFGMGSGGSEQSGEEKNQFDGGGGGGGGGRVLSRPVAVIISDQHGVHVEPVVDPTKIALAFFTTIGFMVAAVRSMRKSRLKLQE